MFYNKNILLEKKFQEKNLGLEHEEARLQRSVREAYASQEALR